MKHVRIAAAALAAILLSAPIPVPAHEHHDMAAEQPVSGQSVYNLANVWTAQDGTATQLRSLRGQPVVLAMVYTRCKEMCPLTIEAMRRVQADWGKQSSVPVRFALFSFDWVRDTPKHLAEFAATKNLDLKTWTLFHGDEAAVRSLAAVLGVSYRRDKNGDFDHSYAMTVLDPEGVIAYQQTGLSQNTKDVVDALAKVVQAP